MSETREPDMLGRWVSNNVSVIITAAMLTGAGVAGFTRLENQVQNLDAYRQERSRHVDARLAVVEADAGKTDQILYRITAQEEALRATNVRVENGISNISERLAEINQALGALSTQVAVLTHRLEASAPQRRTDLRADPERVE